MDPEIWVGSILYHVHTYGCNLRITSPYLLCWLSFQKWWINLDKILCRSVTCRGVILCKFEKNPTIISDTSLPSGQKMLNWHQNDVNWWCQLTINHRSKMRNVVTSTVDIKLTSTVGIKFISIWPYSLMLIRCCQTLWNKYKKDHNFMHFYPYWCSTLVELTWLIIRYILL